MPRLLLALSSTDGAHVQVVCAAPKCAHGLNVCVLCWYLGFLRETENDAFDKFRDIMDKVFHNVATRVVVETPFEEGSDCAELVGKMRESLSNLHFSK